jgi:hypothetical protein
MRDVIHFKEYQKHNYSITPGIRKIRTQPVKIR